MKHPLFPLFLTLIPASRAARSEEVILEPFKDNTLFQHAAGEVSNGAGFRIFTGSTREEELRRALVAFPIAETVPAGSSITAVKLRLYMSKTISGNQSTSLHRVLADWGEGPSDAFGMEGIGADAEPDDATWLHTFYDQALWTRSFLWEVL